MGYSTIQFHPGPRVASVILNRPPLNIINLQMLDDLNEAWSEVEDLKAQVAVISGAGNAPQVVGLVYVAAFAPDEGEAVGALLGRDEQPAGAKAIRPDPHGFLWLDRKLFKESFCQDLGDDAALIMAVAQKPTAVRCFEETAGAPAWKQLPSWYQVSLEDHMIPPQTQQWMAQRIGAKKTVELASSHASLAAYPHELAALIEEAAEQL